MLIKKKPMTLYVMIFVSIAGGFLLSREYSFFPVAIARETPWTSVDIRDPLIHVDMPGTPTHSVIGADVGIVVSAWPETTHFFVRMTKVEEEKLSDDMRRKHEIHEQNIAEGINRKGVSLYYYGYLYELVMVYPDGHFSEENYQRFISSFSVSEI